MANNPRPQEIDHYYRGLVDSYHQADMTARLLQHRNNVQLQKVADEFLLILYLYRASEANPIDIVTRIFANPIGFIDLTANFQRETSFDPYLTPVNWNTAYFRRKEIESCLVRMTELVQ